MSSEVVDTVYGLLPATLQYAPLGDLCERDGVQTGPFGTQLHKEDYVKVGTPIITVEHLGENRIVHENLPCVSDADKDRLAKYSLRTGDIVFSRVGSVDRRALVQPKENGWLFSGRCLRVRPNQSLLDSRWLSYFFGLPSFKNYIRAIAVGATMPSLNTKILSDVPIYFPSLAVQQEAAELLVILDDRITLLRETNTTLEAIAQALFKSWFVDFDPVRAKQEGREPEGMDAETATLFPDSFEESELGLVPKGWAISSIGKMVEGIYDGPHATPPEADEGPIFLGIKNLTGTGLDLTDVRHIHEDQWQQWTRRITPRSGDIVFSYEATLGFFALIPPETRCCLGRRLALIRPFADGGCGHFWLHQFVSPPFQRLLEKHTIQGATVNRIALKQFPNYSVLAPTEAIRSTFDQTVAPLWARIHTNQAKAQTLATLRDTLLPRLISGQLRLPDAEALIEEATA